MAPNTTQQETPKSSEISEKALNDKQLDFLLKLRKQSPIKEETSEDVLDNSTKLEVTETKEEQKAKEDSDLDAWFDKRTVKSQKTGYQQKDSTSERYLFMYNFFLRRKCEHRAAEYLKKIESNKSEKIRSLVSKIREVPIEYIPLSFEKLDPAESKQREIIKSRAKTMPYMDEHSEEEQLEKETTPKKANHLCSRTMFYQTLKY